MTVQLERIDHVGIAIADMDRGLRLYEQVLGMPLVHRETIEAQGVDAALLDVGDGHIELLVPIEEESPVGKFIANAGEGMHHVAYAVPKIKAAMEAVAAAGLEVIDDEPRIGIRNSRTAFVHPKSAEGVLIELVEPASS
ncbi:MAG: methylmalonyl-CoA epimerase [Solirubrobacterales bacterium]